MQEKVRFIGNDGEYKLTTLKTVVDRKLIVPSYQRPYAWDEENIEDLFNALSDKIEFTRLNGKHKQITHTTSFLGSVILSSRHEGSEYLIIDGQQRLTTFLLVLRVIYEKLNDEIKNLDTQLDQIYKQNQEAQKKQDLKTQQNLFNTKKPLEAQKEKYEELSHDIYSVIHQASIKRETSSGDKAGEKIELCYIQFIRDGVHKNIIRSKDEEGKRTALPKGAAKIIDFDKNINLISDRINDLAEHICKETGWGAERRIDALKHIVKYVLKSVQFCLINISGENSEEYAVEAFNTLNTTGQPLTGFEVLKSKMIQAPNQWLKDELPCDDEGGTFVKSKGDSSISKAINTSADARKDTSIHQSVTGRPARRARDNIKASKNQLTEAQDQIIDMFSKIETDIQKNRPRRKDVITTTNKFMIYLPVFRNDYTTLKPIAPEAKEIKATDPKVKGLKFKGSKPIKSPYICYKTKAQVIEAVEGIRKKGEVFKPSEKFGDQNAYVKYILDKKIARQNKNVAHQEFEQLKHHIHGLGDFVVQNWIVKADKQYQQQLKSNKKSLIAFNFLKSINHDRVLPVFYRWSKQNLGPNFSLANYAQAVEACAAFSSLWRAAFDGGTSSIDKAYLEMCQVMQNTPSVEGLKAIMRCLLSQKMEVCSKVNKQICGNEDLEVFKKWKERMKISQVGRGVKLTQFLLAQALFKSISNYDSGKYCVNFLNNDVNDKKLGNCILVPKDILGPYKGVKNFDDKFKKSKTQALKNLQSVDEYITDIWPVQLSSVDDEDIDTRTDSLLKLVWKKLGRGVLGFKSGV